MSFFAIYHRSVRAFGLCGLLLALAIAAGCGAKPAAAPASTTTKTKTQAVKANSMAAQTNLSNEYLSVFDASPSGPRDGKDPFFPNSMRPYPKQVVRAGPQAHEGPTLELTTIFSGKHPEAVVNSAILEVGDKQLIRTADGHVTVHCLEIGADNVLIQVEGEPSPRRLFMKKRKGIELQ
jgi:hypothetical protein